MKKTVAAALSIEILVIAALLTVALDMFAHKRVEQLGGVNIWGYRGPVLRQKQTNEIRIAVAGGDLAFGWGVAPPETLATYVRRLVALDVDKPGRPIVIVTAVNLGALGLSASEYARWIEHFGYLRPDVLCVVPDPSHHVVADSAFLPDRRSLAFAAFGYAPILPLVVREKAEVIDSSALRATGAVLAGLDRVLGRTRDAPSQARVDSIASAVRAGLQSARAGVVLVAAPDAGGEVEDAARRFADNARVRFVDLGRDARLRARTLVLNRFDFSAGGHGAAAEDVAPAALDLLRASVPSHGGAQ